MHNCTIVASFSPNSVLLIIRGVLGYEMQFYQKATPRTKPVGSCFSTHIVL